MSTIAKQPPTTDTHLPALEGDHWIESLRDGTRVLIRPLRESDRSLEVAFITGLSAEAKRYRFLGDFKEASKQLIDQLMRVDYAHDMAFLALAHDNGRLREVGISRYAATNEGKQCECAVTVADGWRHRGLAVLLMQHLIDMARKQKFTRMFSIDDNTNEPMRELAHFLGFQSKANPGDPRTVIYSLPL